MDSLVWPKRFPSMISAPKQSHSSSTQSGSRYGASEQIHSDRGAQFESALFEELCVALGVDKTRTTPYRPQTNGKCERFNRTLVTLLRRPVHRRPYDWIPLLPAVLQAYRSTSLSLSASRRIGSVWERDAPPDRHRHAAPRTTMRHSHVREQPRRGPRMVLSRRTQDLRPPAPPLRSALKRASRRAFVHAWRTRARFSAQQAFRRILQIVHAVLGPLRSARSERPGPHVARTRVAARIHGKPRPRSPHNTPSAAAVPTKRCAAPRTRRPSRCSKAPRCIPSGTHRCAFPPTPQLLRLLLTSGPATPLHFLPPRRNHLHSIVHSLTARNLQIL